MGMGSEPYRFSPRGFLAQKRGYGSGAAGLRLPFGVHEHACWYRIALITSYISASRMFVFSLLHHCASSGCSDAWSAESSPR